MLAIGCASSPRTFRPPHWEDTASTRASIRCGIAAKHGERIAELADRYDVVETDAPNLPEYIYGEHGPRPTIVLDAAARTALASAWRHAVFQHLVPHALGAGWNREHAERWKLEAKELDALAGRCRGQLRYEPPDDDAPEG